MFSDINKEDLFAGVQPMGGRTRIARRRQEGIFTTTTLLSYWPFLVNNPLRLWGASSEFEELH
jgi:hypothetical protein